MKAITGNIDSELPKNYYHSIHELNNNKHKI